jgi:N-acetylglucosaminyl-diphospho-decaprenol L-rhamnosyltransferase
MSSAQQFSVIIVNWNVRERLRACLQSLPAATRDGLTSMQVIVVDNASSDGSCEMVKHEFPHVQLVASATNLGFAAANNLALEHAHAPLLCLLNPDTEVSAGAFDALRDSFDVRQAQGSAPIALAGPQLCNSDGSLQRWTAGAFPNLRNIAWHFLGLDHLRFLPSPRSFFLLEKNNFTQEVDWVSGACMLIRRDLISKPLFDVRYFLYGEDLDLCWRLKQNGLRVIYAAQSIVVHHQGSSTEQQSGAIAMAPIRGPHQFYAQHHSRCALAAFDLLVCVGFALRALVYSVLSVVKQRSIWRLHARRCWAYARASAGLLFKPSL